MNDWFDWKGTRCTSYGIRVAQQPEIIRPPSARCLHLGAWTERVPDDSGRRDVYDDFLLTVECVITDTSQLNAILAWLKGDDKVAFANRQGGFYYARIVNQISLEQILRGNPHRRFSVTFRCQPFFYLSGIPNITVTASGTYVNNVGSVFAEPILKVTLTGDAQITVGASYIEVLGLTGIVTIDTPLMETYKNYTSYNNHMTGDYPLLHTGQNLISWTGGVSQIVITPNWRTL